MLVGRASECARLDELLERARAGRSGVLLLRGEAGIGKTALCAYAVDRAEGMRVLTARGVESESEIPYAGLSQLFRPVLDRLTVLPAPQALAMRAALALAEGPADRF